MLEEAETAFPSMAWLLGLHDREECPQKQMSYGPSVSFELYFNSFYEAHQRSLSRSPNDHPSYSYPVDWSAYLADVVGTRLQFVSSDASKTFDFWAA